jgi:ankyrin repeat protein
LRVELFRAAIKYKQKEALKALIEESTDQSGYVDKHSKFLPEVMRSIIQYEGADILSFIYSNIKFTWSAKKYIGESIQNTLIFRDIFKKIILDTDATPKWLQQVLLSSSSRADSEIVDILLTRVDVSSLDTVQLLGLVVRGCNLNTLLLLLNHPQFSFTPKQLGNALKSISEYTSKEVVEYLLNRNDIPDRSMKGAFSKACAYGRLDIVTILLKDSRVNVAEYNNSPLRQAAFIGQEEIVQLLVNQPQVDPSAKDFVTVYYLVRHNDLDSLKILLEDSRVKGKLNIIDIALYACNIGQLQILNYILETFGLDPSFDSNDLLFAAMNNSQIDIFNWLLKDSRIDPSIDDNEAIRHAKNSNYKTFVKILLQDNRVNPFELDERTFFSNI